MLQRSHTHRVMSKQDTNTSYSHDANVRLEAEEKQVSCVSGLALFENNVQNDVTKEIAIKILSDSFLHGSVLRRADRFYDLPQLHSSVSGQRTFIWTGYLSSTAKLSRGSTSRRTSSKVGNSFFEALPDSCASCSTADCVEARAKTRELLDKWSSCANPNAYKFDCMTCLCKLRLNLRIVPPSSEAASKSSRELGRSAIHRRYFSANNENEMT